MSLVKFFKWHRLFCLALGMLLVALSASTCCIGTLIGSYELAKGNITEQWMIIMLFIYPILAFLSFMVLSSMIKRAKKILNSDDTEIIKSKAKTTD